MAATRIGRKKALTMSEVMDMYIKEMKLGTGLNTRRIFAAWDKVSGASQYTIRRFFRDGKLYITLNSSMVRTQLGFQKDVLVTMINQTLRDDSLFVRDDPKVRYVEELILK